MPLKEIHMKIKIEITPCYEKSSYIIGKIKREMTPCNEKYLH